MAYILHNSNFEIHTKLYQLDRLIEHQINHDDLESLIIVVPTGKLIYNFRREIIKKYYEVHEKPCITPKIFNLRTFATYCFENLYNKQEYVLISEAYQKAIFEEAINKAKLNFFASNKRVKFALVEKLSNLIYGIKEDGINIQQIQEELAQDNELIIDKARLSDILNIYQEYQELLSPNLFDLAEVFNRSNLELDNGYHSRNDFHDFVKNIVFPDLTDKDGKILIWGFSEFKTPEVHFLSHFGKSGIPTAIHLDFSEKNGPLFGNLSELTDNLTQSGFVGFSDDMELDDDYQNLKPSDFFRKYLFAIETPIPYQKANDSIAILEFETIDDEVDYLANLVKYLIVHENYKATDICIVTRHPSLYSDKFRERFYLKGVPAHVSDRYELASSPVINSIFSILSLIINGFDKKDLIKVLSNRLLSIKYRFNNADCIPDLSILRQVASDLRIKGGHRFGGVKQWINRLEKAIEYYTLQLDRESDLLDEIDLSKNLKNATTALNDIKHLAEIFPVINKELTIDEFVKIIKIDIIKKLGLSINISKSFNESRFEDKRENYYHFLTIKEQSEKNAKALKEFIKILDEMQRIFNLRNFGKKYKAEELIDRLKTSVKSGKYQILDKINHGVNVTSIEQIRGIDYKVSILCGANDGELPIPFKAEMLLGKKLNSSESRHENAERIQFYQFLTNGQDFLDKGEKLIFLTHICSDDSGEVVKSAFLTYLCKITGICPNRLNHLTDEEINNSKILSIAKKSLNFISNINDFYAALMYQETNNFDINDRIDINLSYLKGLVGFNYPSWISSSDDECYLKNSLHLKREVFSASELEQYIKCPYQYYVSKFLRVDRIEDKETTLSSLELGSLMHKILQLFYEALKADPQSREHWVVATTSESNMPELAPINLIHENRDNYKEILFDIAKESLKKYAITPEMFKYEYDLLFGIRGGNIYKKGLLESWLDNELSKDSELKKYKPALFEYAFGIGTDNNPITIKTDQGNINIRGKIDRIELTLEPGESKFGFKVADYKTTLRTSEHKISAVQKGNNFQIPLYTKAAQEILEKNYKIKVKPDGAIYYRLNLPERSNDVFCFNLSEPDFESIIDNAVNIAISTVKKINSFEFPVKPKKPDICKYCNFRRLCRIHTRIIDVTETTEEIDS